MHTFGLATIEWTSFKRAARQWRCQHCIAHELCCHVQRVEAEPNTSRRYALAG